MKTILLIALLSTQYKGDNDNVLAITEALKQQYQKENLQIDTVNLEIDKLNSNQIEKYPNQVIIIGAGLDGIKAFTILNSNKGSSKFIWSGHQLINEVTENLKILDNIVLPSYALNQEQIKQIQEAKVKLIETTGIPHTLTKEDCIKEYKDLADKKLIPDSSNGYIFTCLSGDAPDSNGKIKFYTQEEAYKLGEQLAQIVKLKNMMLLVTNGPRTGQYDPKAVPDKVKLPVHEKNSDIDLVSKAFLKGVKSILDNEAEEKVKFENFVFGKPSVFKGYLGAAIENEKSIVVIGGESSSQITQALDLVPGRLYIKKNTAMNDVHEKQVNKILETNKGAKLLNDNEVDLIINVITDEAYSDAEIVAKEFEEENHFFNEEECLYEVIGYTLELGTV
ncbi:hypothetical protein A3306_03790 [Rickettsia bellii]|uniref:Uncharacterized protein n=1 Tax=Rickettsia bellii str. RML An4 TaxID=1359193 RepID=A0A0F3QC12_RICBE|nr:hypothetical protein [Rickettsia bellii]ABV79532.1 hypothetical protein A1I_06060 [Rickettsia bellii OSU 85-389]ARD86324.1 hypothetical protein A3306_03790 [Rickettsia bellii]KJV90110.1 hypothetical protein RBEAN4_1112 [Rickettsia bellii str. RML An4]